LFGKVLGRDPRRSVVKKNKKREGQQNMPRKTLPKRERKTNMRVRGAEKKKRLGLGRGRSIILKQK